MTVSASCACVEITPQATPERILLIEDNRVGLLRSILLREGYRVLTGRNGVHILEMAIRVDPHLILLDTDLPGLNGAAVCRRLRVDSRTCHIPVLLLVADGTTRDLVCGLDCGGVDYVTKPFDAALLRARVRSHAATGRYVRNLLAEVELRSRHLKAAVVQLRDLTAAMALTAERERQQLAAGLHDGILQQLAAARILMERPHHECGCRRPADQDEAVALVAEAIRGLRTLTFELSPPVLYELGLTSALEWLADHAQSRWQLPFVLRTDGDFSAVGQDLAVLLFQVTRELVVNAAKHARAESGLIIARSHGGLVRIVVSDNGRGMRTPPRPPTSQGGGFGLFSIRQRLDRLGGTMDIDSGPEETRVTLAVSVDAVGGSAGAQCGS